MTHTVTMVKHDQMPDLCKNCIAMPIFFLHRDIQQVLIHMDIHDKWINISCPHLDSINIIMNKTQPYVISFTL